MQVRGLIATIAREGRSSYSLLREVQFRNMTDATPTPARRFADLVVPAAARAGYTGHGAQARFARDTGLPDSSGTRLRPGIARPAARFAAANRAAIGTPIGTLLSTGPTLRTENPRE